MKKIKKFIKKNLLWIILGLIILFIILNNQDMLPFSVGGISSSPSSFGSGGGGLG